jgi:hypothetical protein
VLVCVCVCGVGHAVVANIFDLEFISKSRCREQEQNTDRLLIPASKHLHVRKRPLSPSSPHSALCGTSSGTSLLHFSPLRVRHSAWVKHWPASGPLVIRAWRARQGQGGGGVPQRRPRVQCMHSCDNSGELGAWLLALSSSPLHYHGDGSTGTLTRPSHFACTSLASEARVGSR